MSDLLPELLRALDSGERFACATLVDSRGSTPQKTGARALFFARGRVAGTLGGGCLEAEARRRALLSLQHGRASQFTLRLDSDFGWDDGLICGGTATLLLDPDPAAMRPAIDALLLARAERRPAVMVQAVEASDVPVAAVWTFDASSNVSGHDTDGSTYDAAARLAAEWLESPWKAPFTATSGDTRLYLEGHTPRADLIIVGGGHVGAALARFASDLDFQVNVIDDRAELLSSARFPDGTRRIVDEIEPGLDRMELGPNAYVVIVTRGHQHDGQALRAAVGSKAAYVGMIGSRRKVHVIFQALLEEGHATPDQLRRVRAPIGLDIGAKTVEEIALSIAAELVAVRSRVRTGVDPSTLVPEPDSHPPMAVRRSSRSTER